MINGKKVLAIIMAKPTYRLEEKDFFAAHTFLTHLENYILAAKKSMPIDEIIIYAEDKDILCSRFAETNNIIVKENCDNLININYSEHAALYAIESIKSNYDLFVFLQPSAISLTSAEIDNAVDAFISSKALTCASVNIPNEYNDISLRSQYRPYLVSLGHIKKLNNFIGDNNEYVSNGVLYVVDMNHFIKNINFISHRSIIYNLGQRVHHSHFLPLWDLYFFPKMMNSLPVMRVSFGRRLKALRKQRGLTQAEFAFLVDKSIKVVSNVERDRAFPGLFAIEMFATRLSVDRKELFMLSHECEDNSMQRQDATTICLNNNELKPFAGISDTYKSLLSIISPPLPGFGQPTIAAKTTTSTRNQPIAARKAL
jgi:transcriptional regulator with XRE-family HTH domain/CMP-N-acetylneuraminic acid synthetase